MVNATTCSIKRLEQNDRALFTLETKPIEDTDMLFTFLATITAPIIAGTFNAMRDTYVAGYIARDYYRNAQAFVRGFRNGMATEDVPEAGDTAEYELSDEQMASVALGYMDTEESVNSYEPHSFEDVGYSEDDNLRYFQERHDEDEDDATYFRVPMRYDWTRRQLLTVAKYYKVKGYSRLSTDDLFEKLAAEGLLDYDDEGKPITF